MIEVRTALITYLKTLHPRVYFQQAPAKAVFPYLVYDLPSSFSDGEGGEVVILDLDGWDMNNIGDTIPIENLMKTVNSLDTKTLITDEIAVTFYLENKIPILDDDKNIHRRKYTYQGKLIRRD